ncbi:MAG: heavy metal translocating P-type ATPase [Sphingomonadales bacterium]
MARLALAGLVESRLAVPGIRCAGCIGKIERELPKAFGIHAARAHVTAKRVSVWHDPQLPLPDVVAALASIGFAAEPLADSVLTGADDTRDLLKCLAVAGFAAMNIMLLSVSVWSGADGATRDLFHWLSALIALPTVAYAGRPFFGSALRALKAGHTNMDVPISIGVTLATALSLFETITHGHAAYFDSAVMLLFFLLTGRWLDAAMRDRARDGVTALIGQAAPGAMVQDAAGQTRWVARTALAPGMVMLVAAGERLAADGQVVAGSSQIDQSLLTGESAAVPVAVGDTVLAGTLNMGQPISVHVTAAGADTAIADMARLMEDAAQGKSRYVRIADRAARIYAPAVHATALLAFIGWMLAGAGWHQALLVAVAVLIITCPCALGLAVPAAQIVASGALMRAGVLVKDGSALERLAEADRAMLDKTGTLTLGRPQPLDLAALDGNARSIALALAQASRHPLSEALRRALQAGNVSPALVRDVQEQAGMGLTGQWQQPDGTWVPVQLGRPASPQPGMASALRIGGGPELLVQFHDPLRPGAAATLHALAALGLPAEIISGDNADAVLAVARTLQLPARAGLHPADKLAIIRAAADAGHKVLMVGDGLNDGPALAAGHVSLAPASASQASQNAADAVFLGDSLAPIATAISVARATQAIVRQNFALAIGYNIIAVPLAIAGLVTPLIAALAMSGSSLIVVANALRLKGAK